MTDDKWPDLYEVYGVCNDDVYIIQLLKEFHFLANEKKEQTHPGAGVVAIGNEATESF